jgi:prepilin-type N-terminal cleavage/methylation domain-containing protein
LQKNSKGFTIIELAIAIIIMALLLSGASSLLMNYIRQSENKTNNYTLDIVQDSLHLYFENRGKLPCPANLDSAPDSAEFGKALQLDCGTAPTSSGTFRVNGTGGKKVRIGALPTRDLNIPDKFMVDATGSRILYAVTEEAASPGLFDPAGGAISVVDSNDNTLITPAGKAHYVLVSFGRDRLGSYNINGYLSGSCPSGTELQSENCDKDATFRDTILTSTSSGNSRFDDIVRYELLGQNDLPMVPAGAVIAFEASDCPMGWEKVPGTAGRVIVGIGNYDETYSPVDRANWSFSHVYALGETGGYAKWRMKADEMPKHRHDIIPSATGHDTGSSSPISTVTETSGGETSLEKGEGAPAENRPPYFALLYCKKK